MPRELVKDEACYFTQISVGASHTMALNSAGEIYSWGIGSEGRLGHGISSGGSANVG